MIVNLKFLQVTALKSHGEKRIKCWLQAFLFFFSHLNYNKQNSYFFPRKDYVNDSDQI